MIRPGAKFLDLRVGAGFLTHELVGRERQDLEPLFLVLLVGGFESFVLRGQTALAGRVDDQENVTLILREGDGFAVDRP